jgi:hypothetical protein
VRQYVAADWIAGEDIDLPIAPISDHARVVRNGPYSRVVRTQPQRASMSSATPLGLGMPSISRLSCRAASPKLSVIRSRILYGEGDRQ